VIFFQSNNLENRENSMLLTIYHWLVIGFFLMAACSIPRKEEAGHNNVAAEANVKLAIAFLKQGLIKDAKLTLLAAEKSDPYNPAVWYGMGYFNEAIGESAEAKRNYEQAIACDSINGAAHNNYGAFLCRIGQYKESMQQFLLAVKDPNYLDIACTYENAGLCALNIPDKKVARIYFQKALELDPNLPTSRYYLAREK
jgi:type IV pilus assembly protein PilF